MKTHTHTHTPGPWRIDGKTRFGDYMIAAGESVRTCEFIAKTQDEENARLIAAAPDLLAVLKSLVFETSHFLHGDGKNGAFVANELRNAFFAIHKAEGVK